MGIHFKIMKNRKKIQFEFFLNKYSKIHNAKNICCRAFCLAPNERELSNLLTLLILSEGAISPTSSPTSSLENKSPVFLEYVKKSKTDSFMQIASWCSLSRLSVSLSLSLS